MLNPTPAFACRELDLEQGLLLIDGPEFDFDSFPEVAERLLLQIDGTVIERELNADLHVWLIDFEGCRLMLKGEHYTGAITTDQGPFIEIVGYDQKGLSQSGSMIPGTHKWREDAIEFQPPAGCRAVLVQVRRRPSHRFDSKIKGSFWLDNFHLEILDPDKKQVLSDKFL